mgnify:CR=1 FL=1
MEGIIKTRKRKVTGTKLIIEEYMIDLNIGNEINNHKLNLGNDKKLVDAYKEEKELLTSNEIKEIRNMYGMTQKEYAFALGMGEISIHRLEKTFIQSDETDSLMRLSDDPSIMLKLLKINKYRFEENVYNRLTNKCKELVSGK